MNKLVKFTLVALALSVMTACGSGGGSGGDNSTSVMNSSSATVSNGSTSSDSSTSPSNSNSSSSSDSSSNSTFPDNSTSSGSSTSSSNSNSSSSSTSSSHSSTTGQYIVAHGIDDDDHTEITESGSFNDANVEKIVMEGKEFPLSFPGTPSEGWIHVGDTHVCCDKYESKIGYIDNEDAFYAFYNGNPTQDVPQSGTATYKGDFMYTINPDDFEYVNDDGITWGVATYNSNFSDKTLTGTLTADGGLTINIINTKIEGNKIAGEATSSVNSAKGKVAGQFYGSGAKELAGRIQGGPDNAPEWSATFIGKNNNSFLK